MAKTSCESWIWCVICAICAFSDSISAERSLDLSPAPAKAIRTGQTSASSSKTCKIRIFISRASYESGSKGQFQGARYETRNEWRAVAKHVRRARDVVPLQRQNVLRPARLRRD